MKAKKWQFTNLYVYRPGIGEWMKKYPHLAMFRGQPLSDHLEELEQLQQQYKKYLLPSRKFIQLSRKKGYLTFDVRSLNLRDEFPIELKNLKHYPVDRLVKLIQSHSRKVTRNHLLILDNCGKQTLWLHYVLQQAGLTHYNFLTEGVISWRRDGYDRYGRKQH